MAIKTRMASLRSECVQLYWNIWCLNVPMFSGSGTNTGNWDNVSRVTTVYAATLGVVLPPRHHSRSRVPTQLRAGLTSRGIPNP